MTKPIAQMTDEERAAEVEYRRQYREKKRTEDDVGYRRHKVEIALRHRAKKIEEDGEAFLQKDREKSQKYRERMQAEHPALYRDRDKIAHDKWRARLRAEDPEKLLSAIRRRSLRAKGLARATTTNLTREVRAAIPAALPRHVREEVAAAVFMAVFEGRVRVRDATTAIKGELTKYYKQYDERKIVSLDAAHPVTGQAWVEQLDSETPHF